MLRACALKHQKKHPRPILIENAEADAKNIYFFDIHVLAPSLSHTDLPAQRREAEVSGQHSEVRFQIFSVAIGVNRRYRTSELRRHRSDIRYQNQISDVSTIYNLAIQRLTFQRQRS